MKALVLIFTFILLAACGKNTSNSRPKKKVEPAVVRPFKKIGKTYARVSYQFEGQTNGVYFILKCYAKRAMIKDVIFFVTNSGDTQRIGIADPGDISFGYSRAVSLNRWPMIDDLPSSFNAVKKQIKKYCAKSAYVYIEDYKKNFKRGKYHTVAQIIFEDYLGKETYFEDYHDFQVD